MACLAVAGRPATGCDGGRRPIPVSAAAAIDPTDADLARACARPAWTPAMRLCAAILAQAVLDVHRYPPARREHREARAWLLHDRDTGVHSFLAICGLLGYEPAYVRARTLSVGPRHLERRWLHAAR